LLHMEGMVHRVEPVTDVQPLLLSHVHRFFAARVCSDVHEVPDSALDGRIAGIDPFPILFVIARHVSSSVVICRGVVLTCFCLVAKLVFPVDEFSPPLSFIGGGHLRLNPSLAHGAASLLPIVVRPYRLTRRKGQRADSRRSLRTLLSSRSRWPHANCLLRRGWLRPPPPIRRSSRPWTGRRPDPAVQ